MILKKTTHSQAVSSECGHYERSMLRILMITPLVSKTVLAFNLL
ncbi:MAG: hypothetical protein RG741_01915 [Bacteroidales bacterium]|nr:hypothetical protein [Bacteroidales bacterium]